MHHLFNPNAFFLLTTSSLIVLTTAIPQTSTGSLPACAVQGGLAALSATGCAGTDISCICHSSGFLAAIQTAAQTGCSAADYNAAIAYGENLCASVGVPLASSSSAVTATAGGGDAAATSTSPSISSLPQPQPQTSGATSSSSPAPAAAAATTTTEPGTPPSSTAINSATLVATDTTSMTTTGTSPANESLAMTTSTQSPNNNDNSTLSTTSANHISGSGSGNGSGSTNKYTSMTTPTINAAVPAFTGGAISALENIRRGDSLTTTQSVLAGLIGFVGILALF